MCNFELIFYSRLISFILLISYSFIFILVFISISFENSFDLFKSFLICSIKNIKNSFIKVLV